MNSNIAYHFQYSLVTLLTRNFPDILVELNSIPIKIEKP